MPTQCDIYMTNHMKDGHMNERVTAGLALGHNGSSPDDNTLDPS
jgi:hypothetical protein